MIIAITFIVLLIGLRWYLARVAFDYRTRATHWLQLRLSAEQLVILFLFILALTKINPAVLMNLVVDMIYIYLAATGIYLCILAVIGNERANAFRAAVANTISYTASIVLILIAFPLAALIEFFRDFNKTDEERAKENYRLHRHF